MFFKKLFRMLKPGPRKISKEEMMEKIDDFQDSHGVPEDRVPWKEMRNDEGGPEPHKPCGNCTCSHNKREDDDG